MSIKISPYFQPRWSVFWATTFTFEPSVFDEFWFPQLGQPPLSSTVLVDAHRLAQTWSLVTEGDEPRIRRVNRDYLVRGVNISRGSFDPKTYFFANSKDALLLVGSGNLTHRVYMDWFLRSLLAPIDKYVASNFPKSKEEAIQVALKFDLIYPN